MERLKSADYSRCSECAHQILLRPNLESFIENEELDETRLTKISALDRFQVSVALDATQQRTALLDVGSGSGRFLFRIRSYFKRVAGVEVTDSCIDFSRNKLHLDVAKTLPNDGLAFDLATFWHSLEHIPENEIKNIFGQFSTITHINSRILISVPNVDSVQYKLFTSRWPYYDVPHHFHQFSALSLNKLMTKFDLEVVNYRYGFAYSVFGFLQGFLNLFNSRHNFTYYRKKRGWDFGLTKFHLAMLDFYNLFLAALFAIPALILAVYEMLNPAKNGVITVCFKPAKHSSL